MSLRVDKVKFYYDSLKVLENISFEAGRGEFIGLIGPNGSGKTTLLKIIEGLLKPKVGVVYVDGAPILNLDYREKARKLSIVPQNTYTDFDLKVIDVVMMGRYPYLGRLSIEGRSEEEKARFWMEVMDILHLANRSIREVSGGEFQRIIIARALAQEPRILLLDEPTANLDIRSQIEIMDLLKKLVKRFGLTIICAIHDLNLAARYCERIIMLGDHRIEAMGRPEKVLTKENLRRVFGIESKIKYMSEIGAIQIIPLRSVNMRKETSSRGLSSLL